MKKDRIIDCIKHGEEQFAAQSAADKQKQNQFIVKTKIEVLQQVLVDYNKQLVNNRAVLIEFIKQYR